jgi:hypothetical protein
MRAFSCRQEQISIQAERVGSCRNESVRQPACWVMAARKMPGFAKGPSRYSVGCTETCMCSMVCDFAAYHGPAGICEHLVAGRSNSGKMVEPRFRGSGLAGAEPQTAEMLTHDSIRNAIFGIKVFTGEFCGVRVQRTQWPPRAWEMDRDATVTRNFQGYFLGFIFIGGFRGFRIRVQRTRS